MCLFSPLCKNDEEEAAIRGFTDNRHASKESRQQTTRVDMLLYLSRKEFQKLSRIVEVTKKIKVEW